MLSSARRSFAPLILLLGACSKPLPLAQLTSSVTDSAGVTVVTLDRPLADIALGKAGGANDTATLLFVVDSMTHPVAVTFLPNGEAAILDRLDRRVAIVDGAGSELRQIGARGEGPGELEMPAGLVALGSDLVVLQSHPSNTLVRFGGSSTPQSVAQPIPGDWNGWMFQRPDIALEFPVQSAPELWSRRIRALNDSSFIVYVGPRNEDTSTTASGVLLRLGADLQLRDTVASFPATRRELRPATDRRGVPELFQRVWAPRMVWGAADDRLALGMSDRGRIEVKGSDGALKQVIRWPLAATPVTETDRAALGSQIVGATLAASPDAAANAAKMSSAERDQVIVQFMATYELALTRPELVALFLSDGCLWMAGFDSKDDADGTAHEWLVLDLDHPAAPPRVVTIGGERERVVAIGRGMAATIRLEEDGFRRVRAYKVPACGAAA